MQSFAFNRPPPGRYGSQIAAAHLFQVDGDVGLQPLQSGAIGARLRPFRPIGRDARIGQVSATDIDARHPFPPIWTGNAHRYHNRCVWIGLCQTAQPGAIRAGFGQPARRVEPAVGLAVIGQPGDVPVADIAGVGLPDLRPAADEHDAPGESAEHGSGSCCCAYTTSAVVAGKCGTAGDGLGRRSARGRG